MFGKWSHRVIDYALNCWGISQSCAPAEERGSSSSRERPGSELGKQFGLDGYPSRPTLLLCIQEDATPLLTATRQVVANAGPSVEQPSFQSAHTSLPGLFFSRKRARPVKHGTSGIGTKKHQPLPTVEEKIEEDNVSTTDCCNKDYVFPWRAGVRKKVKEQRPTTNPVPQATDSSKDYIKLRR